MTTQERYRFLADLILLAMAAWMLVWLAPGWLLLTRSGRMRHRARLWVFADAWERVDDDRVLPAR